MNAKRNLPWVDCAEGDGALAELLLVVRACVEKLPPEYQEALATRDVQEISASKMSGFTDLAHDRVDEQLADARAALRSLLEPYLRSARSSLSAAPKPEGWRWCERPRARGVTGWGQRIRRSVHPGANQ